MADPLAGLGATCDQGGFHVAVPHSQGQGSEMAVLVQSFCSMISSLLPSTLQAPLLEMKTYCLLSLCGGRKGPGTPQVLENASSLWHCLSPRVALLAVAAFRA